MELDVRHMRVICTIADTGSLTKAAAQLQLSQPALTAQLQRIERLLGGQLFIRTARGVAPTALGEFVVTRGRILLPMFDEIQQEAVHRVAREHPVRFVAMPGPLMMGLLTELQELLHGTEVKLRTEQSARQLVELITNRQQDLGALVEYVRPLATAPSSLIVQSVAREPAFVLLPENHPLAAQAEVDLAELAEVDWVLPPPMTGNGLDETFAAACAAAGFTPSIRHEADATAARELIANGGNAGLGLATFRTTPGIAPRPLTGSPLHIDHVLLWHRNSPLAPLAAQLVPIAQQVHARAVQSSPHYLEWLHRHA